MQESEIKERFLKAVEGHKMRIIQNDGLHRHVRFRNPARITYFFDLITWPGYLCITGDFGCYVFSRIDDMFEFFRNDEDRINQVYWAEKIQAQDKYAPAREFSESKMNDFLKENIPKRFNSQIDSLFGGIDNLDDFYQTLDNFVSSELSKQERNSFDLDDIGDMSEFSFHYLWCLYSIVWGINKYDKEQERKKC